MDQGPGITGPDATVDYPKGTATCSVTNNDPRVAGKVVYTWKTHVYVNGQDFALTQSGTGTLRNAGGARVGRYTGIATSTTGDILTFWYTGTGGYTGLSYYMWETVPAGVGIGPTHGLIVHGTPPTP
jgi:hypothetical protein